MRKKRDFVFLRPVKWLGIGMMAALVVACEKPVLDTAPAPPDDGEANVVLRFCQYEGEGFVTNPAPGSFRTRAGWGTTRAMTDITEICSRLNIAIFDTDGTKVKTIAQKRDDAEFGTVAMSLAAATYRLVVIAHNCDGSATISSEEKVTFPNNKVTDTFYYYGDLVVTSAADVGTKLPTLGSGGISGWDVPTSAQLKLVEAQKSAIANAAEGKYYLYRNADGSKYYYHRLGIAPDNQSFGSAIGGPWPDSFEILLRPVAVVTVAAE